MERDQFLKTFGLGLALVCTGACFQGCKKGGEDDEDQTTGNNNQVSVDISSLANVGSQKVVNGVLFIRLAAGSQASAFVATEAICPHQGGNLSWLTASNKIQCDNHFAQFSSSGTVLVGPSGGPTSGVRALKVYSTAVSGTTLTATKA